MNLIEKILLSHKLKHESNMALMGSNDMTMVIQDHYDKPRISVFMKKDSKSSVLFEIGEDCISVIDSDQFTGDLMQATALIEKTLGVEVQ